MLEKLTRLLKGEPDELSENERTVMKIIERYRGSLKTHPSFKRGSLLSQDCLLRLGVEENEYLHVSLHLGKELEVDTVTFMPWRIHEFESNWPLHGDTNPWAPEDTYHACLKRHRDMRNTVIYKGSLGRSSSVFRRFIQDFFKEKMDEWCAKEDELAREERKWRAAELAEEKERRRATVQKLLS